MAGLGKGGTGFKGNAGGGWGAFDQNGAVLKVRYPGNQCMYHNCGGHSERGRPEGGVNLPGSSDEPEPRSKEVRGGPQPEAGQATVGYKMRSWLSEAGRAVTGGGGRGRGVLVRVPARVSASQPGTLVCTSGVYVNARDGVTAHMWAGHVGLDGGHRQGAGSQS